MPIRIHPTDIHMQLKKKSVFLSIFSLNRIGRRQVAALHRPYRIVLSPQILAQNRFKIKFKSHLYVTPDIKSSSKQIERRMETALMSVEDSLC